MTTTNPTGPKSIISEPAKPVQPALQTASSASGIQGQTNVSKMGQSILTTPPTTSTTVLKDRVVSKQSILSRFWAWLTSLFSCCMPRAKSNTPLKPNNATTSLTAAPGSVSITISPSPVSTNSTSSMSDTAHRVNNQRDGVPNTISSTANSRGSTLSPLTSNTQQALTPAEAEKIRKRDALQAKLNQLSAAINAKQSANLTPGSNAPVTPVEKLQTYEEILASMSAAKPTVATSPTGPSALTILTPNVSPSATATPDSKMEVPATAGTSKPASPVVLDGGNSNFPNGIVSPLIGRVTQLQLDKNQPVGLPNISNSCYMNASLQALQALAPIFNEINEPILKLNLNADPKEQADREKALEDAFKALIIAVDGEAKAQSELDKAVQNKLNEKQARDNFAERNAQTDNALVDLNSAAEKISPANVLKLEDRLTESNYMKALTQQPATAVEASRLLRTSLANAKREVVRQAVSELIKGQNEHLNSQQLKSLALKLRDLIFNARGLTNDRNADLEAQQDAAAFTETILGPIVNLRHLLQYQAEVPAAGIVRNRSVPQPASLIQIQLPVQAKPVSMQEILNARFATSEQDSSLIPWKPASLQPGPGEKGVAAKDASFAKYLERTKLIVDLKGVVGFHFVRFKQNADKNMVPIEFSKDGVIDLSIPYGQPAQSVRGKLKCFVVHHGDSVGSGHYTAYVKKGEQWFHCDDERITPLDENELATAKKDAYIAFFERI